MSSPKPTLHVGIMAEEVQLSDIMGIDVFGNVSTAYVETLSAHFPIAPDLLEQSIPMKFYYLASTLDAAHMTPSLSFIPTVHYDDAPRNLDVLIIGGVTPGFNPPGADKFLREQKSKVIMTICTGAMWLASAGGLKGKRATTNRAVLPGGQIMHPDTEWVDQRWVVDGNLWTSGGAGAGIDMIVSYARQNFPKPIVETLVVEALEFDNLARGQFYPDNPRGEATVGDLQTPYWEKQKKLQESIAAAVEGAK